MQSRSTSGLITIRRGLILLCGIAVGCSLWLSEVPVITPEDNVQHMSSTATFSSRHVDTLENYQAQIVPRYFEVESEFSNSTNRNDRSKSSFHFSTVVRNATSWFTPRRICKAECCAETVAISIDHEPRRIINTMDGSDLADLRIHFLKWDNRTHHRVNHFNERMLPCLQPGTIFFLENYPRVRRYFWEYLRPKIEVPFVLITSKSDADSPTPPYSDNLTDPLLLKWYGTNPLYPSSAVLNTTFAAKFQPMHLGLSFLYAQEVYLRAYLESTNYTNPFLNKRRFLIAKEDQIDLKKDMLIQFGLRRPHRERLWRALCNNFDTQQELERGNTTIAISCIQNQVLTPGQWYSAASHFLFGLSPPGKGWDCYRTYELLLLGIIPIVEERRMISQQFFEGLPVIQVPILDIRKKFGLGALLRTIKNAAEEYLSSKEFQPGAFTGWERLFLGYWRQSVLRDAGRETEIIRDENGNNYWQSWHYTPMDGNPTYCSEKGACL